MVSVTPANGARKAIGASTKKSPAEAGLFRWSLVAVPTMFADHDAAVVAIAVAIVVLIPAMMQVGVGLIDPNDRAVIAVAIIAVVAADVDAEALGAGYGRSAD